MLVSSPNTIPPTDRVPLALVGSPFTMAMELLVLSGKPTPSTLPIGVPVVADETTSTRSLPFEGSYENGVAKGITKSKGQGPAPAQPGEDPENAPLYTVVASGPTLLPYVALGRVCALFVLGYACVVDSVILDEAYLKLTGPAPTADRKRRPVIRIGPGSWPLPITYPDV